LFLHRGDTLINVEHMFVCLSAFDCMMTKSIFKIKVYFYYFYLIKSIWFYRADPIHNHPSVASSAAIRSSESV
jgi:hypothetical protein